MTAYEKPKRKNDALPQISIWKMLSSIVSGFMYYGIFAPIRWIWQQFSRFMKWSWHQTKRLIGWTWRQSWLLVFWSLHVISTIAQKTVLAPFIALGRLLGFVANPIPDGLSPSETEAYQRISRQYRRQKRWYLHILTFLMGMTTLWASEIFSGSSYPRTNMVIMMTVIWMIALGGHRLWMNLGASEDREIGNALHRIRKSNQVVYYEEEEYYDEQSYDISRLEDADIYTDETDEELLYDTVKAKRQRKS